MKKSILPLAMFCMYFTGEATTNAMEDKEAGSDPRTKARAREHLFQSSFFPEDEDSQVHLMSAIHGEFDPEAQPNEEEDMQLALLVSRLEHALLKDDFFASYRTDRAASSSSASSKGSASPKLPPIGPGDNPAHVMPVYKEGDGFNQMVVSCAQIYINLGKHLSNKGEAPTVETLTASIFQYSEANKKGWPTAMARRIAEHFINLEDLEDSPDAAKKAPNNTETDKK